MRSLLLAFALFAAFTAGRAYGEPSVDQEIHCARLSSLGIIYTGGASQEELRAWFAAGDDAIGYDESTGCLYVD